MAYTKIKSISTQGHLNRLIGYAMDESKTIDADDTLSGYVANVQKTDGERYVTCINCEPHFVGKKMAQTKKEHGKTDGRLAYHLIQSFAPGEATPELAHKIGVEYAEKLFGEYEVIIATHLDKGFYHNHIVLNSVSCMTGKKFHMNKSDLYTKIRGFSDELCRKYGLSVITYTTDQQMSYAEYKKRHAAGGTLKQIIQRDIELCIGQASSVGAFYTLLENMGYEVALSGKNPRIRPPEGSRYWRLNGLGFTSDVLYARIYGYALPPGIKLPKRLYCKHRFPRQKLTYYEAIYLHYLYLLGKIRKYPHHAPIAQSEIKKFNLYKQQLRFVAKHNIKDTDDVIQHLAAIKIKIKELDVEKFKLRGAARKHKKLFDAHMVYERYKGIYMDLDGERKSEFLQAKEIIERSGYIGGEEKISALRISLANAREANRTELQLSKNQLWFLEGILKNSKTIKQKIQEVQHEEKIKEEYPAHEKEKAQQKAPVYPER